MRLIDADELIAYIESTGLAAGTDTSQEDIIKAIETCTSAYDVDKVVESLMNRFRVVSNDEDLEWNRAIDYAIGIIKDGVRND